MENKQTVLIVDDIADNLNIVANALIPKQINVLLAQNGEEAFNTAEKHLPDLILLDIMMPEIDGFEVCKKLKENKTTNDIPIIFLSAKSETESIIHGFKLGAVDYISKPFFEPELIARVKTHLDLKKSKTEIEKHRNNLEELVADRTIELRTSRNNFKNIFNSSSDAIFITDLDGNFLEFNDITGKRIGLSKKELFNLNLKEFHRKQGKKSIESYFSNVLKHKLDVCRTYFTNNKGDKVYVEINGTIITHKNRNAILHVSRDTTERQKEEKQKLNLIIETEEKERKRFAKDLHDGLGATLSAAKMYMNIVKRAEPGSDKALNMLDEAILLVDKAGKYAKEIAVNIRPHDLAHFGLATSLHNFCDRLNAIGTISVHLNENDFDVKLNEEVKLNLYRSINELINNTLKYAEAKNIIIDLYKNNKGIVIEYSDDGKGFDYVKVMKSNKKGTGLDNIIYRAKLIDGDAQITSQPGKGMSVIINVEL